MYLIETNINLSKEYSEERLLNHLMSSVKEDYYL